MNINKNIEHFKDTIERDTEKIIFGRQENNQVYLDFSWSNQLYSAIISGNTETILTMFDLDSSQSKGTMAKDKIRDQKNQILILLSFILYRLEDDRFIEPNITHAIIDSTSTLLEMQTTPEKIQDVTIAGILAMSAEVQKEKRSDYHPLVRRTEDYVFSHLHDKITVTEIAQNLSADPEYLTTVFHRYTGKSIKKYIIDEKINRAQNLLVNSDFTIEEIAIYLGFSDSSHLGREFKKRMQMSPKEYRKKVQYK